MGNLISRAKISIRSLSTILYRLWLWARKKITSLIFASDDLVEDFRTDVNNLKIQLLYMINIENGLLDELILRGLLTKQQVEVIHEQTSYYERISRMIDDVLRHVVTDDNIDQFLTALDQTLHAHVSNYIDGKGQRSPDHGDYWPLIKCQPEANTLENNCPKFTQFVNSKHGLIDEMFSAFCLTRSQKQELKAFTSDAKRNDALYYLVRRGSLAAYKAFIRCLVDTKQHHIASLLAPNILEHVRPISDKQKYRLQEKHKVLVELIDTTTSLLPELISSDCITWQQRDDIQAGKTSAECNDKLLDIIALGSEENFEKFIECLNQSGQRHIGRILSEDGPVAKIIATNKGIGNWKIRERKIASRLMSIQYEADSSGPLSDELQQHVSLQQANDAPLIAIKEGDSISFYYLCKSLRGLEYLYKEYSSGRLQAVIQDLIVSADAELDDADGLVDGVDTSQWEPSSYINCVSTLMNLSMIPEAHRLARQSLGSDAGVNNQIALDIDEFPFELTEMMFVKAAGQLFNVIDKITPRADLYTLVILCNVSSMWWEGLTRRKFIKRSLKRYFRQVCHPFQCNPKHMGGLQVQCSNDVMGVVEFEDKLYVVCEKSNRVNVYESLPPFRRLGDIEVPELNDPCDVVVCNKTSQLYIADIGTRWSTELSRTLYCIWRVELLNDEHVKRSISSISIVYLPMSLSIKDGRLLVTARSGDSLFLHDEEGNQLSQTGVPREMLVSHAVQTNQNTYIVSHYNQKFVGETQFELNSVTEIDIGTGEVIQLFNSQLKGIRSIQFNRPQYLGLHQDHVIIADTRSGRIILSTSGLQFKRIILHSLKHQPRRLYVGQSQLLLVSYVKSREIDVYSF